MRILVGFIWDGCSGGIDAYLMAFAKVAEREGVSIDFLTNEYSATLENKLLEMGHRLHEIATLHNRSAQRETMGRLCRENEYTAAYFNISTALMLPIVKDAKKAGVPCVAVHSHAAGNDQSSLIKRFLLDVANCCLRGSLARVADCRFACSSAAAKWAFGDRADYAFVPNPVDVGSVGFDPARRERVRRSLGLQDKYVVGSVTAMKDIKNPYLLIDVFAEYSEHNSQAYLLVVGGGELFDEVSEYAERKLRSDSYTLLGKRDDVPDLLQAFDVFLLTSKREGLSIAAIEAQSSGLPCLFSSGIPDEAVVVKSLAKKVAASSGVDEWVTLLDEYSAGGFGERASHSDEIRAAGYGPDSPRRALDELGLYARARSV